MPSRIQGVMPPHPVSVQDMTAAVSTCAQARTARSHFLPGVAAALILSVTGAGCSGSGEDTPTPDDTLTPTQAPEVTPTAIPETPTPTPEPQATPTVPPNVLNDGQWLTSNAESLRAFGEAQAGDDPRNPPNVVFNWDHVSIFNSAAEATLRFQLSNLAFKITPGQLEEVLPISAGADYYAPAVVTTLTAEFGNASIQALQGDIVAAYQILYDKYEPMGGCKTGCDDLETLKATAEYKTVFAKMLFLYQGLKAHPDVGPDYTAVMLARLHAGFTEAEIRTIASDALDAERDLSIQEVSYSSPSTGAAGKVSGTFVSGIRLYPEMLDLYDYLRRLGYEIWVVSAAPQVVVQAVTGGSSGYSVNAENVIGVQVEREGRGNDVTMSIIVKSGVPIPYGEGKVDAIRDALGQDPVLVVGGTAEDYEMLTQLGSEALSVVINRMEACPFASLYGEAINSTSATLGDLMLQGVDDNEGAFRNGQTSIPLGESSPSALPGGCD